MEWQPIETAPKDGARILVFCPEYDDLLIDRYGAAEWESDGQGGGFWLHNLDGEPTHWMPLPDPPLG